MFYHVGRVETMRLAVLALTIVVLSVAPLTAGDSKLAPEERSKALEWMKKSRQEFLESVEKLSDAQWNYKPSPERWSVGEVAEHILLSEGLLFGNVEKALASPANPDWEKQTAGKAAFIEKVMPDRSRKATAPEAIQPKSNMTRAEIISRYKDARAKTIKFTEGTDLPLKEHTVEHPFPVFGTLNAHQWLIYVPLHNIRHNLQIAEVKADPGFPK